MANHPPKISIIIPYYNVERYIGECLDSVLAQSLEEIEVLCINDASSDDSEAIVRQYAARDKRVRCFSNSTNSGVSVARNKGLENAIAPYVYIMDSDDFLHKEAIRKLYDRAIETDGDLVMCDAYKYFEEGRCEIYRCPHQHKRQRHWQGHAAWWFILKRSLLVEHPDIRFPEGAHPVEDTVFSFMLFSYVRKYAYIDEPLIYYRQHRDMRMRRIHSDKKQDYLQSITICFDRMRQFMREHPDIRRRRERAHTIMLSNLVYEACDITHQTLADFPYRIRWFVITRRIKSFIISIKITNSDRLLLKIFKIPVFRKKVSERWH